MNYTSVPDGLKISGNHMNNEEIFKRYDDIAYSRQTQLFRTINQFVLSSDHDVVSIVAARPIDMSDLESIGIECRYYGIDPIYSFDRRYVVCDVIFDTPSLEGLIIHGNAQKTYPIGKIYTGEFIIVGHAADSPGDCNNISSCDVIIQQNNISKVLATENISIHGRVHHMVWGRND